MTALVLFVKLGLLLAVAAYVQILVRRARRGFMAEELRDLRAAAFRHEHDGEER